MIVSSLLRCTVQTWSSFPLYSPYARNTAKRRCSNSSWRVQSLKNDVSVMETQMIVREHTRNSPSSCDDVIEQEVDDGGGQDRETTERCQFS
jgi:hypothetical protein